MKTKNSIISTPQLFQGDTAEPDVWWGEDGIDAQLWADGQLYDGLTDMPAPVCEDPMVGGVQ